VRIYEVGTTIPTDIEIRRNHMFKPLTWMAGQPGFVGGVNTNPAKCVQLNTTGYCPFVVKNLFELKNAETPSACYSRATSSNIPGLDSLNTALPLC
jgi:hypothetical protein